MFLNLIKRVFSSKIEGEVWIGEGFNSTGKGRHRIKKPDLNGKVYTHFCLIEDGPNKGLYAPTVTTKGSGLTDNFFNAEIKDIRDSGFDILFCDNNELI